MLIDWQNQHSKNGYTTNTIPIKIPMTSITEIKISTQSSLGNIKDLEYPCQYQGKRAMLEVSQYPISNYITEP
jgi:hypothetical protein